MTNSVAFPMFYTFLYLFLLLLSDYRRHYRNITKSLDLGNKIVNKTDMRKCKPT